MRINQYFLILVLSYIGLTFYSQSLVNIKKIDNIFVKIDNNQPINKGQKFRYEAFARMKNGKIKKVNTDSKFTIKGEGIRQIGSKYLFINKNGNCEQEYYKLKYALVKKGETFFEKEDSVKLNYKGHLNCNFFGESGSDGSKGGKSTTVNRDGADGENGDNGQIGKNGLYIKAFIRNDTISDLIKIDVHDIDNNLSYCYKLSNISEGVTFNISGGDGGNGGNGGRGRNGKNELQKNNGKIKAAGNGGNGGDGGNGGNGGNGGSIEVYIHKDLSNLKNNISIIKNGGKAGKKGTAGSAGIAGKDLDGHISKKSGYTGTEGQNGTKGQDGSSTIVIVDDINFKIK